MSGVEARWAVVESGVTFELVIELDLVSRRCRLVRKDADQCKPEVLRESLIDGQTVCVEIGNGGLRAVTVPEVLVIVEGNGLEGVYARSPWLDALGVKPGCLELVSLRIF